MNKRKSHKRAYKNCFLGTVCSSEKQFCLLCIRADSIELGQQEGALCPIGMGFVFVHALGLYAAAYIRGIFLIPVQDLQSVLIIPLKYPQAVVDNGNLTRMDDRFADEAVELKNLTKRIDNTLLHNTFGGEPLRES